VAAPEGAAARRLAYLLGAPLVLVMLLARMTLRVVEQRFDPVMHPPALLGG
jgi:hypothetical protein